MRKILNKSRHFERKIADRLPGGLADRKLPKDFDQKQLEEGIKVEMEHTNSRELAREIAMDHLVEDPDYYRRLKTIHAQLMDYETPGGFRIKVLENELEKSLNRNMPKAEAIAGANKLNKLFENNIFYVDYYDKNEI